MTVAIWPEELPKPERQTFQLTYMEARLKRQGDAGPPAYRRRFSSVAKPVTLSFVGTRSERAIFETFYVKDTAHGALPFYMPDPTTDGWPLLLGDGRPMLTSDGEPILIAARWLCLFGDSLPTIGVLGITFRVTFNVWVMP
jgi:hypothetical protein